METEGLVLRTEGLVKRYGKRTVVNDVSFNVKQGEIVGLIKATAIVGYIAVQDLTKMGDIVRSRTYEAFFPLIAVTVIYFILEGLLGFLVSKIQIRMNPKKRKPESILKGVNVHD